MALPRTYTGQACSIARALEVVGERWTLLIVRDAFFGVRRFSDFAAHLDIPRAVLTERLASLVDHGVLARVGAGGRDEYVLTDKGQALWPVVRALAAWGDEFYAPNGPRRLFRHAACHSRLDATGGCPTCGTAPPVDELETLPGPGFDAESSASNSVSVALRAPHQLLAPLVGGGPAPTASRARARR